AVRARKPNGTPRRPSSSTTPNGPMIACVTHGRSSPIRYITPSGWTSRVREPPAGLGGNGGASSPPCAGGSRGVVPPGRYCLLSPDDVAVEPGVDGALLRAPGVRVDRLRVDD